MAHTIATTQHGPSPARREDVRARGNVLRPAVDIFETEEGLTLIADLPGVTRDQLDINLERGVLTITGDVTMERHGEPRLREFELARYYRQFQLPEEVDADKTSADFTNGVLTLKLPKAEAAKPRRITIRH